MNKSNKISNLWKLREITGEKWILFLFIYPNYQVTTYKFIAHGILNEQSWACPGLNVSHSKNKKKEGPEM